nr:unnamed protein product [Callosobruchus analis]CAI5836017.1 unnamed protein product [Callosobruchus analis]
MGLSKTEEHHPLMLVEGDNSDFEDISHVEEDDFDKEVFVKLQQKDDSNKEFELSHSKFRIE